MHKVVSHMDAMPALVGTPTGNEQWLSRSMHIRSMRNWPSFTTEIAGRPTPPLWHTTTVGEGDEGRHDHCVVDLWVDTACVALGVSKPNKTVVGAGNMCVVQMEGAHGWKNREVTQVNRDRLCWLLLNLKPTRMTQMALLLWVGSMIQWVDSPVFIPSAIFMSCWPKHSQSKTEATLCNHNHAEIYIMTFKFVPCRHGPKYFVLCY